MMNTAHPTTGTYRVYFRLGAPGTRAYWLQSSRVVEAESRAAAVASVPGGEDAEVIRECAGDRPAVEAPTFGGQALAEWLGAELCPAEGCTRARYHEAWRRTCEPFPSPAGVEGGTDA